MNKLLLLLTISVDEIFKKFNQEPIKKQRIINNKESDSLETILETDDKGFILGGWSNIEISEKKRNVISTNKYYWFMKINSSGTIEWKNCIKRNQKDSLNFVSQTMDKGFILKGTTFKNNQNISFDWLIKLNSNGEIVWENQSSAKDLPAINPPVQAF